MRNRKIEINVRLDFAIFIVVGYKIISILKSITYPPYPYKDRFSEVLLSHLHLDYPLKDSTCPQALIGAHYFNMQNYIFFFNGANKNGNE